MKAQIILEIIDGKPEIMDVSAVVSDQIIVKSDFTKKALVVSDITITKPLFVALGMDVTKIDEELNKIVIEDQEGVL